MSIRSKTLFSQIVICSLFRIGRLMTGHLSPVVSTLQIYTCFVSECLLLRLLCKCTFGVHFAAVQNRSAASQGDDGDAVKTNNATVDSNKSASAIGFVNILIKITFCLIPNLISITLTLLPKHYQELDSKRGCSSIDYLIAISQS